MVIVQLQHDASLTSAKWTPTPRPVGLSFTVNCRCIFISSR